MAIKFPKLHIATSVFNRIQNALESDAAAAPMPQIDPVIPDPSALDASISMQLETPLPEASGEPLALQQIAADMGQGGSPLEGLLNSGSF